MDSIYSTRVRTLFTTWWKQPRLFVCFFGGRLWSWSLWHQNCCQAEWRSKPIKCLGLVLLKNSNNRLHWGLDHVNLLGKELKMLKKFWMFFLRDYRELNEELTTGSFFKRTKSRNSRPIFCNFDPSFVISKDSLCPDATSTPQKFDKSVKLETWRSIMFEIQTSVAFSLWHMVDVFRIFWETFDEEWCDFVPQNTIFLTHFRATNFVSVVLLSGLTQLTRERILRVPLNEKKTCHLASYAKGLPCLWGVIPLQIGTTSGASWRW